MKLVKYSLYVLAIAAILASAVLRAETIITTDDGSGADTFIYYFNGDINFGDEPNLWVGKNYVPYLKFDLSAIGPNTITDANLTLYGTPHPEVTPLPFTTNFSVWGLLDGSDSWGELAIKYNNAPLVTNPITWNPSLVSLGTLYYESGDEGAITMVKNGSALVNFLNDRGPDGLVTFIIGSDNYGAYAFFSTKEDHGDASEAPFLTIQDNANTVEQNNWVGTDSNDWFDPDNWLDESNSPSVPDSNAIVNINIDSNLPVVIDANASAKKVFVHAGGMEIHSGILSINSGILRIKDGLIVDITDGEIHLEGNVEGRMWGLIGKEKIVTTKEGLYEVCAAYDPNTTSTIVKSRKLIRKLAWGSSIVSASGPTGEDGSPASCSVDGSGMIGEAHIGFIHKGEQQNSYYGRNLDIMLDPPLDFEFDRVYDLTNMYVWNYEDHYNGYGFKQVRIEYSTDGISYTTLMNGELDEFTFAQGSTDCNKSDTISFGGVPAKYVRLTAVGGPGVGNYETTYLSRYILKEVQFCHEGMEASNPSPASDSQVEITVDKLVWLPGNGAVTGQDVWFGTDPNAMAKIGDNIAPDVDFIELSTLESGTTYYWRVDGLDTGGSATTGYLWNFHTRAWLHWNPGGEGVVYAYGSPGDSGSAGENAANESGITGNLHAPFQWSNGWYCRLPGSSFEPELFVEFDRAYDINEIWVWNHDGTSDTEAAMAMKTVQIEYSLDDVNYTTIMNGSDPNWILPHGNADGTHDTAIKVGAPARYIKFTAVGGIGVGNYGSTWGYKLRELRFYHDGLYAGPKANYPTPPDGQEVDIFTDISWSPGEDAVTGQDIWLGKSGEALEKIASNIDPNIGSYTLPELDNYSDYIWRIDSLNGGSTTTGDEWHLLTHARLRWNPGVIGVVWAEGEKGVGWGAEGYYAANESGLDYDLHASFLNSNGWYCRQPWDLVPPLEEPNLLITFDRAYDINEMWVWNHDGTSAAEAAMALKTIQIEYSTDGVSWTNLMNGSDPNFILPHGNTDGTHDTEIGFGNVSAKYVRITAVGGPGVGNYGSTDWGYKLREVRFFYEVPLWSDLSIDKRVDFEDFAIIAADWLEDNWTGQDPIPCPGKPGGDVTGDCKVNESDIYLLASEWLEDIN